MFNKWLCVVYTGLCLVSRGLCSFHRAVCRSNINDGDSSSTSKFSWHQHDLITPSVFQQNSRFRSIRVWPEGIKPEGMWVIELNQNKRNFCCLVCFPGCFADCGCLLHSVQMVGGGNECDCEVSWATHRQASHQALLKGTLESSGVATPVQQLCRCRLEICWIL